MHILKTISLCLVLSIPAINYKMQAQVVPQTTRIPETPDKTIFIKHPAANDPATYFATSTMFTIYIYKPGNIATITDVLKKEPDIENYSIGALTGDYQQIDLNLKSVKDKMWFIALFKKAGLSTIKINNNPIKDLDHM